MCLKLGKSTSTIEVSWEVLVAYGQFDPLLYDGHGTQGIWRAYDSWSSMVGELFPARGLWQQMLVRNWWLGGVWSRCGATRLLVAAISSGKTSRAGSIGPLGWRERATATLCSTPGMCTILNLYLNGFSLRLRSLEMVISLREHSPNTLRRGLWSTAISRSLQPSTKNCALSRALATARASPSIRA